MSETVKLLKIKPALAGLRGDGETFKYKGFECPSCKGRGYHLSEPKGYHGSALDDVEQTDCFRCGATGHLCADVVIRWSPDEKVIE